MRMIVIILLIISGCQIKSKKFSRLFSKIGSAETKRHANAIKNGIEARIPIKTFVAVFEAFSAPKSLLNAFASVFGEARIPAKIFLIKNSITPMQLGNEYHSFPINANAPRPRKMVGIVA